MSKPTLIYFAARGRAELIRIVAHEAGVEYTELTDFDALKGTPRLPFDAVPVWEESGGFRLAQSMAIVNHIARGHDMLGKSAREAALCEQMLGAFDDLRGAFRTVVLATPEARPAVRQELVDKTLPRWLGYLDRLLGENNDGKGYLVGDRLSVGDLALWYLLEIAHDNGLDAQLAKHPRLVAFAQRIGRRPRLIEYTKSPNRHPVVLLPT